MEICGTTPLASTFSREHVRVAAEAGHAFLNPGTAAVGQPDHEDAPTRMACSITLQIFSAWASDREPPKTVKS